MKVPISIEDGANGAPLPETTCLITTSSWEIHGWARTSQTSVSGRQIPNGFIVYCMTRDLSTLDL
jgi:hypothetical protein